MRQFFPADFGFKFQSDEYNGHNRDVYNFIRCGAPGDEAAGDNKTKFCGAAGRDMTIDCAERENADSRLFMGVHWIFDADDGIVMGNAVAKDDSTNLLTPEQAGGSPPPRPFGIANLDHKDGVSPFEGKKQTCPGVEYPEGLRVAFGYSTQ